MGLQTPHMTIITPASDYTEEAIAADPLELETIGLPRELADMEHILL